MKKQAVVVFEKETARRVLHTVREVETARPQMFDRGANAQVPLRRWEGVLETPLARAPDLNTPQSATFRIKTTTADGRLISEGTLTVWSRARRMSFERGDYGWAVELYPNVFFFVPMDCPGGFDSSSGSASL